MNDAAKKLIAALREMPADAPYEVPGDGLMIWDFGTILVEEIDEIVEVSPWIKLDKSYCGSVGCAKGLAKKLGITTGTDTTEIAKALEISYTDAAEIFMDAKTYGVEWKEVTPQMVADELERRLS